MSSSASSSQSESEYTSVIPAYLLDKNASSNRHNRAEGFRQKGKRLEEDLSQTYPSEPPPELPVHCQPKFLNNGVGGARQTVDTAGLM
jgi:hypothetical protein